MSAPPPDKGSSARAWWDRQGRWKWFAVGVLVLAIAGSGEDGSENPPTKASGSDQGRVQATKRPAGRALTPGDITPDMVQRDGRFWVAQSDPVKAELVEECLKAARRDEDLSGDVARYAAKLDRDAVSAKLDRFYADEEEHFFGGTNAETPIAQQCGSIAEELATVKAENRRRALEASVEPDNFRATPRRIRRYFKLSAREDDLRSVSCQGRATCNVAINSTVGDLGIIAKFLPGDAEAYGKDFVLQLATDITPVFERLFGDPRFRQGTVSAWLEVQDVGGNVKRVPAMTVTCDRSADRRINWERVGDEGLAEYCAYDLTPIRGVSAP